MLVIVFIVRDGIASLNNNDTKSSFTMPVFDDIMTCHDNNTMKGDDMVSNTENETNII